MNDTVGGGTTARTVGTTAETEGTTSGTVGTTAGTVGTGAGTEGTTSGTVGTGVQRDFNRSQKLKGYVALCPYLFGTLIKHALNAM